MESSDTDSIDFGVKIITWSDYDLQTPILLQDINGPCPLIALVNTMFLKAEVENRNNLLNEIANDPLLEQVLVFKNYLAGKSTITLNDLLSRLGDLLIKFSEGKQVSDLDKLLESLPLLHTGLSVNPDLSNGEFEKDLAIELFGIFNLTMYHGWIINPEIEQITDEDEQVDQHQQLVEKFKELKYFDSIQDYLLSHEDEPFGIRTWLNENSTQLTTYGIKVLNSKLDSDDFIIFFRNNHFSTLYKKNDNDFYLLLTDSSFSKSSKIVWQSLISISGKDDLFFTGDFLPVLEDDSQEYDKKEDENYILMKQLQEEDDKQYAERLQRSYVKKKPPVVESKKSQKQKNTTTNDNTQSKTHKTQKDPKSKKDKKSNCIIV